MRSDQNALKESLIKKSREAVKYRSKFFSRTEDPIFEEQPEQRRIFKEKKSIKQKLNQRQSSTIPQIKVRDFSDFVQS